MRTTILAYVIAFLGLIMIAGGIWGLFDLIRQTVRIPLRYYAMVIGMMCGGFAAFTSRHCDKMNLIGCEAVNPAK